MDSGRPGPPIINGPWDQSKCLALQGPWSMYFGRDFFLGGGGGGGGGWRIDTVSQSLEVTLEYCLSVLWVSLGLFFMGPD